MTRTTLCFRFRFTTGGWRRRWRCCSSFSICPLIASSIFRSQSGSLRSAVALISRTPGGAPTTSSAGCRPVLIFSSVNAT